MGFWDCEHTGWPESWNDLDPTRRCRLSERRREMIVAQMLLVGWKLAPISIDWQQGWTENTYHAPWGWGVSPLMSKQPIGIPEYLEICIPGIQSLVTSVHDHLVSNLIKNYTRSWNWLQPIIRYKYHTHSTTFASSRSWVKVAQVQ